MGGLSLLTGTNQLVAADYQYYKSVIKLSFYQNSITQKLENLQVLKFFLVIESGTLFRKKMCVPKIPDMGTFRNNFIPSKIFWYLKMRYFFHNKKKFHLPITPIPSY